MFGLKKKDSKKLVYDEKKIRRSCYAAGVSFDSETVYRFNTPKERDDWFYKEQLYMDDLEEASDNLYRISIQDAKVLLAVRDGRNVAYVRHWVRYE